MKSELSLIIPVYNEEEIIEHVISDWSNELDKLKINYEIHSYNDGSKDNSLEKLNQLTNHFPRLIVHNKANSGHGPTILKGYRENNSSEWIFQTDSDNELPASYFKYLWKKRDEFDFLIGIRDGRSQHPFRRFVSAVSRWTVWLFYNKGVKDVNAPYRLMRVDCFKDMYFKIPDDTFAPNLIVSGYAVLKNLRIYQIPVPHQNRSTGQVSIKKFKLLKAVARSYFQTIKCRFNLN